MVALASGGLVHPCGLSGVPVPPSDGTSTGLGVTAKGVFIWSGADGLHGYLIPKKHTP